MDELTINHILGLDIIGEFVYFEETDSSCDDIFSHIDTSKSPLLIPFMSKNISKEITSRALKIIHDDRYETGEKHIAAVKILKQLKEEEHFAAPDEESFVFTRCHVDEEGNKRWKWGDKIHRDDKDKEGLTLPALIYADGDKYWYKNGKCHRDDKDEEGFTLPAAIWADGSKGWYKNGRCHRDDKDEEGLTLPAVIWDDGSKRWCKNGERIYL